MHNLVFVVLLSACIENAIVPSRTEPAGALDTSDTAGG